MRSSRYHTKGEQREARRLKAREMTTNGRSVFLLQRIVHERAKKERRHGKSRMA